MSIIKRLLLVVSIPFWSVGIHAMGMYPLNLLSSSTKDLGVAFLKSADAIRRHEFIRRQQQLAKLEVHKEAFASKAKRRRSKITQQLQGFEQEKKVLARGGIASQVKDIMGQREKIVQGITDTLDETEKVIEEHVTLLKRFIGVLGGDIEHEDSKDKGKDAYSWVQFKEAQQEIEEQKAKLINLAEKKELLERDISRLRDQEALQKKQYKQEIDELERKLSNGAHGEIAEQYQTILGLKRAHYREILENFSFLQEKNEQRLLLQQDEIALQEYLVGEKKQYIPLLKKQMVFSSQDIDLARQELKNQETAAKEVIEKLNADLKKLKEEKERLEVRYKALVSIRGEGVVHEANCERLARAIQLLEQKCLLLIYKNELTEGEVAHKKLQLAVVEVMRQRANDINGRIIEANIDRWLARFRQESDGIESFLEKLHDRSKENRLRSDEIQKYAGVVASKVADKDNPAAAEVYKKIAMFVGEQHQLMQEVFTVNSQQIKQQKMMRYDLQFLLGELDRDKRSLNIWQRSDKALSTFDLKRSLVDARRFFSYLTDSTIQILRPQFIIRELLDFTSADYIQMFILFCFLLFFVAGFRWSVVYAGRRVDQLLYVYQGQIGAIYLTIVRSFIRFVQVFGRPIGIWLFVRLHVFFEFQYIFMFMQPLVSPYTISIFYIFSIPLFLYVSHHLMIEIKKINQRMSFLFFTEKLQEKFLFLLTSILYTSAVLLPLRKAFMFYHESIHSPLPDVIYGAWTLILSIVFLFFFSKEDVLRFLPSGGVLGQCLQRTVNQYYYPVFLFFIGLFILVNPYVGYSNFAMYLAMCIPLTIAILYAMFKAHSYLRKFSFFMFMREDEEEGDSCCSILGYSAYLVY